ncbi:sugar ABC transporter substrate-binding protein [Glaciihabitans sp. UYNi722]|uniref:ABC transporter substrate-binding protein n=1 Tax=Glaciihabitans sp. UYNi722 TaxID=3156344 RepID=UPI003390F578
MEKFELSRRGLLMGGFGAASLLALSACSPTASTSDSGSKADLGKVTGTISFAFWGGSDGETAGFKNAKAKFEAANPGATIDLKIIPYESFFSGIDRGITAGKAPDLFRVDYTTIGKYSSAGVLMDLSPYFTDSETKAFLPALWEAIKFDGKPYGVPHQTDTTAIIYSKSALEAAGITSIPNKLEDAWTWDEFSKVADKLRASLPDNKYPFAYNWTAAGAFRWANLLYQAGGSLLTKDLKKSAVNSKEGLKAMNFAKSFFEKKWVPANNIVKTATYSDNLFVAGTAAMTFVGDFQIPFINDVKDGFKGGEWGTTFMIRDKKAASDLGGNAIVARKDTKNPKLAAAFLKFLASEKAMQYFCEQAMELPTLTSLTSKNLSYVIRPDAMATFTKQAATITDAVVKESTVSAFSAINTVLQDQLELAFQGKSSADTLKAMEDGINAALAA